MIFNQPYDPMSMMRFQVSILSLAANLELAAPVGSKDAAGALVEAAQLQKLVAAREK